ncbi:hypothetical protein GLOTRDRAFT_131248 [Gloeophyllum trabeum ATCC 11539]|uniref:F-box domain-containing protein n=1 Tax=Gloeophyllum trabeum (strain ATCC 11539 / FP-39264 / Madison 617) TaxID=670483 RepID=S7RK04_GLOTA|nr:uncharacterized protein GLOTRDRAFT_131248 [Gloeophyllum trabeum ATCC 11539]EPQ52964.1 hypothetical protein GLOTRDRAFT_131248 [Gloeophyllum trabeum ATCC 11539]
MRLFPAPVHSNLQSLCLRSPGLTVGYAPVIGLDILTFPHLTGLELVNLAFGRDTSTERFILRHKATLRRLEVIDCLMVCNELEVVGRKEDNRWEMPRTWEDTFDGFRKELGCLQEIEVWEYGYGRYKKYLLLDVKVYREQEDADAAALQELESVVKRRRDEEL